MLASAKVKRSPVRMKTSRAAIAVARVDVEEWWRSRLAGMEKRIIVLSEMCVLG